jgi:hypothetical protein
VQGTHGSVQADPFTAAATGLYEVK